MKLSERLELVLSFVEPGESAADVGTDHGHVPVELVRRTIVKKAVAMDVRKGPLSRATENIALAGLADKIETRLSDGVAKLQPGEADSVVIAGMGGELIIKILENGRHMWDSVKQWVLSPQSEIFKVRRWLFENGFVIRKEEMVREKRNEVFYETYSEYAAKVHLAKDDSLWKNLSITDGERTSADFFEIFETICKGTDS